MIAIKKIDNFKSTRHCILNTCTQEWTSLLLPHFCFYFHSTFGSLRIKKLVFRLTNRRLIGYFVAHASAILPQTSLNLVAPLDVFTQRRNNLSTSCHHTNKPSRATPSRECRSRPGDDVRDSETINSTVAN